MNSRETFKKIGSVIFDMDGVVTREDDYWLTAELTVVELLYSDQFIGLKNDVMMTILYKPGMAVAVEKFVSPKVIAELKSNGINTNWDLAFYCAAIYIIELLSDLRACPVFSRVGAEGLTEENLREMGREHTNPRRDLEHIDSASSFFMHFRKKMQSNRPAPYGNAAHAEDAALFFDDLNSWLAERTGMKVNLFDRCGPFWQMCRTLFQERYLGDRLFNEEEGGRISKLYKDGLLFYETPIVPLGKIIDALAMLKEGGLSFGIATGRPYTEIITPLERWGLLHLFDPDRIATWREQLAAEKFLAQKGEPKILAKPHPYLFLRALYPGKSDEELLALKMPVPNGDEVLIVGDSASDIMAGKTMGCRTAVVLTGVKDLNAAARIKELGPDFILNDVTEIKSLF